MKKMLLFLAVLSLFGCATMKNVPFHVTSNPTGCPIDVDGVSAGDTPTTINLRVQRRWVGLVNTSDGWEYGYEQHNVTCYPPKGSNESLISQTKIVTPGATPEGADIYFDLQLVPVYPSLPINIKKESTAKDEGKTKLQNDTSERLIELKNLKDKGLITEKEYQQKREGIINKL